MSDRKNGRGIAANPIDIEKIKEHHEQLQKDLEASQKSDDTEDRVDSILYGPFSMTLAHFFIKHGISANKVTLLSLFFGVLGSFFFYPQNVGLNLVGIIIEYFAVVLDCTDGPVARLTNTGSQLGRFLDGAVDITNFAAIYIVLACRMMHETIPFTNINWSGWIFLILLANGYCHGLHARMADFYRTLHLHLLDRKSNGCFNSSEQIKKELSESKNTPFFNRLYLMVYYNYTKAQEKMSPNVVSLLEAIEAEDSDRSRKATEAYLAESRKYVQLTNVLTYNLRAYALYILILLKLHPWFIPFNIIVLGAIMFYMIAKYEKIAESIYDEYYA